MIEPGSGDVLIVVDMQNDFMPGGSLGTPGADEIIPLINTLAKRFFNIVLLQDWHPADHISFASNHQGKQPFDVIDLPYGPQVLWPDHCIQGSFGAQLHPDIDIPHAQLILRKGYHQAVDSYSGFQEADRRHTGLAGYLKARHITRVYTTGVATDYCVGGTAMDAVSAGFEVGLIEDAARGIDSDGSLERAWTNMQTAGVNRLQSIEILG
jgi:nicotinamidase/pyrazinamidase